MLPSCADATTTTVRPAMTALAGLVPCADAGMSTTVRPSSPRLRVPRADDEQAGQLALRAGVRLQRHRGEPCDLAERRLQFVDDAGVAGAWSGGTNGCRRENSGHVIGSISAAAFSFIVHEPSGIIDVSRPMSRLSSARMYRIISISE
jgi:hypothetical protein